MVQPGLNIDFAFLKISDLNGESSSFIGQIRLQESCDLKKHKFHPNSGIDCVLIGKSRLIFSFLLETTCVQEHTFKVFWPRFFPRNIVSRRNPLIFTGHKSYHTASRSSRLRTMNYEGALQLCWSDHR